MRFRQGRMKGSPENQPAIVSGRSQSLSKRRLISDRARDWPALGRCDRSRLEIGGLLQAGHEQKQEGGLFRLERTVHDLIDGSGLIVEEFQFPAIAFWVRPDKAADAHWLKR